MKARSTSKKTPRVKAVGRGSRSAAPAAVSGDRNGIAPAAPATAPGRRGKSLAAVNAWLSANEKRVLKAAARNCAKLTGKPRF